MLRSGHGAGGGVEKGKGELEDECRRRIWIGDCRLWERELEREQKEEMEKEKVKVKEVNNTGNMFVNVLESKRL